MNGVISCWQCGQSFNVFPTMHGRRIVCGRCQASIDVGPTASFPQHAPAPMHAPAPIYAPAAAPDPSQPAPYHPSGRAASLPSLNQTTKVDPEARQSRAVIVVCAAIIGVTVVGLAAAIAAPMGFEAMKRQSRAFGGKSTARDDETARRPPSWQHNQTDGANPGSQFASNPLSNPLSVEAASNDFGAAVAASSNGDDDLAGEEAGAHAKREGDIDSVADSNSDGDIEFGSEVETGDGSELGGDRESAGPAGNRSTAGNSSTASVVAAESGRLQFVDFSFVPPAGWRSKGPDREVFVAQFSLDEDLQGNGRGAILIAVDSTRFSDSLTFVNDYTSDRKQKIVPAELRVDGAVAYGMVGIQLNRILYSIACVRNGRIYLIDGFAAKDVNIIKEIHRLSESWRWNDG